MIGPRIPRPLDALARECGLQLHYRDTFGRICAPPVESVLALLRMRGENIRRPEDAQACLNMRRRKRLTRRIPPLLLCAPGKTVSIPLAALSSLSAVGAAYKLILEDGKEKSGRLTVVPSTTVRPRPALFRGNDFPLMALIPESLPPGLHRLQLDLKPSEVGAWLLCSPLKGWKPTEPPSEIQWGLFAPVYAGIPSSGAIPAGDLEFLDELVAFTARFGGGLTATLPLYPFARVGSETPSPYSPSSRLLFNDFYVHPESLPEYRPDGPAARYLESRAARALLQRLRASDVLDYPAAETLKHKVLARLAAALPTNGPRADAYRSFLEEVPDARDFARFCTRQTRSESGLRTPSHILYAQFAACTQLAGIHQRARRRGVSLYADLPIGVAPDGYDAWKYPHLFVEGAFAGAPPDDFFPGGQNWGFHPAKPEAFLGEGFPYFRAVFSRAMRFCDVLRLDHVMSFHRLFWIPKGFSAHEGAYVHYPSEIIYRLATLESHRHHTRLVGEDLGTVPSYVRRAMASHGFARTWVFQFEASPQCRQPSATAPRGSLAALNTHDTPPFAAFWHGSDIEDRADLGLLDPSGAAREAARRSQVRNHIRNLAGGGEQDVFSDEARAVMALLLKDLMGSRARWELINLEDLWGERRQQNWPGVGLERPSWRRKFSRSLQSLAADPEVHALFTMLNGARTAPEVSP